MKLKDQVAIVTGAGEGIGRGIALAFAREGAHVAVCARTNTHVEETARQIAALGRRTHCGFFDAADEAAVTRFVAETAERLGPPTLLVPNAATMPFGDFADMEVAAFDHCYAVKVKSAALFAKHCIPHMKKAGTGSIVFMASVAGHTGMARFSFYGAMNAALIALARGLALELAPSGVRVNSVSPGTVDSPMLHRFAKELGSDMESMRALFDAGHPRGRIATIEEIAATFVFLAGPDAANITATDILCDGGFTFNGVPGRRG
ncbi:SDR family oxidoreductase [Opitutus sp. GAS368]|jgi:NAD(P)-dependent dehydrogenase (short-subunit alcohol dehydrogenase family)|uniref:SDR family NAD(P)-dependent oxidoreductase n=1 Tax=Opitutus sp. GAS368 TaxID=1882749 RepID=UPI00087C5F7C|nr:SDR family oxidoreductase [Opitutus sp. GAS368]SDS19157.1 NAD(P)-dependent dehydrogenase, short-chain alcohol dehydrogenase family [Opitutus sp. GAS368]